jgi:proline iminopeptidase
VRALTLALVAGVVWGVFLAPVPYDPYTAAGPTSYWHLPTGSDIAYTRTATGVTRAEPVVLVHGGPGAPDD